jgi:hypothetical protein
MKDYSDIKTRQEKKHKGGKPKFSKVQTTFGKRRIANSIQTEEVYTMKYRS